MHDTTVVSPDLDWASLFDSLARSSLQVSLVVTGGGSGAVARCFRRVGASQTFVEAVVPYSRTALAGYLTATPRGSDASPERAHQLASTALSRADAFADRAPPYEAVGISLAAALPTIPKRLGTDRIHVSLHTQSRRLLWSVELSKDAFDRATAEAVAEAMIFIALSELCCNNKPPAIDNAQIMQGLELVCKQG